MKISRKKSFRRADSGNVGLLFALSLPIVLGFVGAAVDSAYMLQVKTQLQKGIDTAVLLAARDAETDEERREAFLAYLETSLAGESFTVTSYDVEIDKGLNFLRIEGHVEADVRLFFMHHLGIRTLSATASAFRATESLEIAVVLDNTGSMGAGGINALKRASHALVDAVDRGRSTGQDIRISLVPFVTAVNIKGEDYDPAWVDKDGQALYNGWNFIDDPHRERRRNGERSDTLHGGTDSTGSGDGTGQACANQGQGRPAIEMRERCLAAQKYPHHMYLFEQSRTHWKGCVEARPYPYNFTLEPPDPANPDTLFVPYFAPDEPGNRMNSGGNSATNFNNSWLDDEIEGSDQERLRSTVKYINPSQKSINDAGPLTIGPNRACPTPIVPLSTDFSKVRTGIDAMNYWNGSGTNIAEGLAWGWRVLSPDAPYPGAAPFDEHGHQKIMVLMTDGRNVSYGARDRFTRSDYGAYNFLANGLIDGTSNQGVAERALNNWTSEMCTQMKEQGIEIFTVVYNETDAAVLDLFRRCASRTGNFYMTSNTAALENAFMSIGQQVSRLRITR
jgi:hypothetical protein